MPLESKESQDLWLGSQSGISVQSAIRRLNEGRCFPQMVVMHRGIPVLAAVLGVAFEDDVVQARLLLSESAEEIRAVWPKLELRASSRELWGAHAGKHRARIWIELADGWWAIRLSEGDDERMARGVMRHVIECVGRSRAMLEARLAELDPRYRIEALPQREQNHPGSERTGSERAGSERAGSERAGSERAGSDGYFHELTPEHRLEALLTLRMHIIEATDLDDLDEDTTVLEALREQALEASADTRERLRHACSFELAVGRYLGAEALCCTEPRTRAVRRARMHEAFDAACKAFSEFVLLGSASASGLQIAGGRLCSIDG